MTRNELISQVAVEHLRTLLETNADGTLRFCMVGFDDRLVVDIARAALDTPSIASLTDVRIPSAFVRPGDLPADAISDESITHWRHHRLEDGRRAILSAATHAEVQKNEKSVEKITKIETDRLRELYTVWMDKAGLTIHELDQKKRSHLAAALKAANDTHVVLTIGDFADYVLGIADAVISMGLPLQKALDHALPALRLPRYAGIFESIPEKSRELSGDWAKQFQRLHRRIRPLLMRENEKGEALTDQLRKNLDATGDRLPPIVKDTVSAFIAADLVADAWIPAQVSLVDLDWRTISEVFEGSEKRAATPMGERTIKHLKDEFDVEPSSETRAILEGILPKEPTKKLEEFFQENQELLARDKTLHAQWENFIFQKPETYDDFLVALVATMQRLRARVGGLDPQSRSVVVRIPRGREKSFWKSKNKEIARYLAYRYRGLENLFGPSVRFEMGKLCEFFATDEHHDFGNDSSSKDARQIKFEMELDSHPSKTKMLFVWEMPATAFALGMPDDLLRAAADGASRALLPTAVVARQAVSAKGQLQRITLADGSTIRDVAGQNEGRLVDSNIAGCDRTANILAGIEDLVVGGVLRPDQRDRIKAAFDEFHVEYTAALRDWTRSDGAGIASTRFLGQVEAYGKLLTTLHADANNDRCRETIWRDVLCIGLAIVGGGAPATIVAPWHPLRLSEIHVKAVQTAKLLERVISAEDDDILRADVLFVEKRRELEAVYYPEVCIGFDVGQPVLLAAADTQFGYTLAEPPCRRNGNADNEALDVDPGIAARAFGAICERYLELLPHERTNFSVVLFNAESKALPGAIAAELSSQVEKESDLQCDLLLTHSQPLRMRRIYEQQNAASDDEGGLSMASEAARNFLSRLRVGFLDANATKGGDGGRAADLVLLQDVIARNAAIRWKEVPISRRPDILEHVPARWSRRRPVAPGDATASVYLAAPVQSLAGQSYLNAVHAFLEGGNAQRGDVLPAREITFKDRGLGDVFRQTHTMGEWVVNFDEMVDRRLLSNNGVQVIRHIHDRSIERNIVVSTTSPPRLLMALLRDRLNRIDPRITEKNGDVIARLIDRANSISGQVVMRAARYGHYANELLGVVLSMQRLEAGLGVGPIGWYFLDDFASWFGQKEETIADVMAIAPRIVDGKPVLKIAISEAKFVVSEGYKAHANKSARQLDETVQRLTRALDPHLARLDREAWLHRIGDFIIEGMETFDPMLDGWDLYRWSDEVREDRVPIELVGFSHVFVHDDEAYVDAGVNPIKGGEHCAQEILDKPRTSAELRRFAESGNGIMASPATSSEGWELAMNSVDPGEGRRRSMAEPLPADRGSDAAEEDKVDLSGHEPVGVDDVSRDTLHDSLTPNDGAASGVETGLHFESSELEAEQHLRVDSKASGPTWPSPVFAEWIGRGRLSGEDDPQALAWLEHTVKALQRALRGYDMTAEVVGARLTPNAALIRLRGTDELTIPKIERRRQELLTSHAISVITVLGAPMEIIVMVRRPERAVLRLQDMWRQRMLPESAPEENTSLLIGSCETDGEMLYLNVGEGFGGYEPHGPHTLIAGESGSGKGVLLQCLLLDICATNSPRMAQIHMIDPKAGIDFPWLRRMPHLAGDLVTTQEEAVDLLGRLVDEMERRNRLLADAEVTKLAQYNKRVAPEERLPRIWLFHDELADWMLIDEYRDAVETNVIRLGVKARAAGINLVMVTQRPDKDALPMQLRANLSNRLVLKVADRRNSELVLDDPGAELLLGRGHLAAKLSGEGRTILAQVPFATEDEITEVAGLIRQSWKR